MRVVHFTDTYLPRRDGVITSIRSLVDVQQRRGQAPLIVVPRHPDQDEAGLLRLRAVPLGVADLRVSPWLLRAAAAEATIAAMAARAPDVIHVHTPGPLGLLGVVAARRLGIALVQTYHTDLHAYAEAYRFPVPAIRAGVRLYARRLGVSRPASPPTPRRPWAVRDRSGRRHAALDGANALLLGGADAVVVPTRAVLDRISLPVPDERIFLVPTGVAPCPTTAAAVASFRRRHGIAERDRVVLFVGRVNREKGVDLLIPAYERVLAACPEARLVLVGALYDERWFTALLRATGRGVAERIVWTGQLPPAEVAAAYGAAEVLAFPSRTDTQALVLQEAGLAGVPAVLVDPVLHRYGPLAGAAIRTEPDPVDFAGGLLRLLGDPATGRELGAAAAAHASRHTPDRYADAMLTVYRHAVATRRVGPGAVPVPVA